MPVPALRKPFIFRADPQLFGPFLETIAREPVLLRGMDELAQHLAAAGHPLLAQARWGRWVERAMALLGTRCPIPPGSSFEDGATVVLDALKPYLHFLTEIGAALKVPLARPRRRDIPLLGELAELCQRHRACFEPGAKWLVAEGLFTAEGLRIRDPEAEIAAPSVGRFFAGPPLPREEDEQGAPGNPKSIPSGYRAVILYMVTVGPGWDGVSRRYFGEGQVFKSLLANALGAGAADTVARDLNDHLDSTLLAGAGGRRFRRLSPGYGGWPLGGQRFLTEVLNTGEDLGVTVTEGDMLVPEKSTCGIMAVKRRTRNSAIP